MYNLLGTHWKTSVKNFLWYVNSVFCQYRLSINGISANISIRHKKGALVRSPNIEFVQNTDRLIRKCSIDYRKITFWIFYVNGNQWGGHRYNITGTRLSQALIGTHIYVVCTLVYKILNNMRVIYSRRRGWIYLLLKYSKYVITSRHAFILGVK